MKDYEIATKYNLDTLEVKMYIKENAGFGNYTESFFGDITLSNKIDVEEFIKPLIAKKEEKDRIAKEKEREEKEEQNKERQKQYQRKVTQLKERGLDGYYEYKVISLSDVGGLFNSNSGRVDTAAMTLTLNELGVDGWHLVTAYSNELGKNALSGGAGGALLGVNSTVDENILIFERFVKI